MIRSLISLLALLALSLASAQPVTLSMVGFKYGPVEGAMMDEINQRFMEAHPDIKVEYQPISGYDTYRDIIRARLAGGDAPDIFMGLAKNDMILWSNEGYLADLSSEPWVSRLVPSAKAIAVNDDSVYQMVAEYSGIGLFVNLDLLEQASVEIPTTYPEFLGALEALQGTGAMPILLGGQDAWSFEIVAELLASNSIYREEPTYDQQLINDEAQFNSAEWQTILEKINELAANGLYDPQLALGIDSFDDAYAQFSAGRVGFIPMGSWGVQVIKDTNPDLNFAMIPFPGTQDAKPYAMDLPGMALVVDKESDNLEAAKTYLEFFSSPDIMAYYLTQSGAFSPFEDVEPELPAEMDSFSEAVSDGRTNSYPPFVWPVADMLTPIRGGLQDLLGGATVEEVLNEWDAAFDEQLTN